MTLIDIYAEFTVGSDGFCRAVETHCGFDLDRMQIERIAKRAGSAAEFRRILENEDWWL